MVTRSTSKLCLKQGSHVYYVSGYFNFLSSFVCFYFVSRLIVSFFFFVKSNILDPNDWNKKMIIHKLRKR